MKQCYTNQPTDQTSVDCPRCTTEMVSPDKFSDTVRLICPGCDAQYLGHRENHGIIVDDHIGV